MPQKHLLQPRPKSDPLELSILAVFEWIHPFKESGQPALPQRHDPDHGPRKYTSVTV